MYSGPQQKHYNHALFLSCAVVESKYLCIEKKNLERDVVCTFYAH